MSPDIDSWLAALEQRHLANLTRSELTRALRALSSCYVERREKLASGAALEGAGKRAAFALFYGPLHFLTTVEVVRALGADAWAIARINDLGCGTGAAGAAWALAHPKRPRIDGVDRNPWVVQEANWSYRELGLQGAARVGDIGRLDARRTQKGHAVLLAYTVNELPEESRASLLRHVTAAVNDGSPLLVIEPIAKRLGTGAWFDAWSIALAPLGAKVHEWRFRVQLPPLLRDLAKGAGLNPQELTARTLCAAVQSRDTPMETA